MSVKKLLALVALVAVSAVGSAQAEMVYHRGSNGEPASLDLHRATMGAELFILRDLYEGLVTYNAAGDIIPGVAQRWDVSDDGLIYTFHLRQDAKWSNGQPVTASDFVFSLRRATDPATAADYANMLFPIKNAQQVNSGKVKPQALGVKAIDDHTLQITLQDVTPYFIGLLTNTIAWPVYAPAVKRYGDKFVKPGTMVSNGAFVLKEHTPNDSIVVVKNPYFHDAANVAVDKEIFYPLEDTAAALRRFVAGELDTAVGVPLDQAAWMREHLGNQFRIDPRLGIKYYAFDTRHPPFNDPRVRHALSMVIDRQFLADKIWAGAMLPAYSFVPPGIPGYGQPETVAWKDKDLLDRQKTALALMKEVGYGPGHPLDITLTYYTNEQQKQTAVAIADMWKPLGVKTKLINSDAASHFGRLSHGGRFDVANADWGADYPDAQNFLYLLLSTSKQFNFSRFYSDQFDSLMAQAGKALDVDKRSKLLHQAQAILEREEPNISLFYYSSQHLVSNKVSGWQGNALNQHLGRWISIHR